MVENEPFDEKLLSDRLATNHTLSLVFQISWEPDLPGSPSHIPFCFRSCNLLFFINNIRESSNIDSRILRPLWSKLVV